MDRTSSEGVTTAFLERFGSSEFDEAGDLIHPEGPLEGAGDVAMLVSLLATDFLAALVLGAIPTEVTGTTFIEEGPTRARVEAHLDVAGVVTIESLVELRPRGDERDPGDGRRDGWSVWSIDVGS